VNAIYSLEIIKSLGFYWLLVPVAEKTDQGDATLNLRLQFSNNQFAYAVIIAVACIAVPGCHRRGYTDLYLESMATEVRELEDQLYEYDHEYKLLEQELESLRRQNAALKRSPAQEKASNSRKPSFESNDLPSPKNLDAVQPKSSQPSGAKPQGNRLELPKENLEAVEPVPSEQKSPSRLPPPSGADDFNIEELSIPSIITGSKTPPALMLGPTAENVQNELELSLTQIELPSQLASAKSEKSSARILPAVQIVKDQTVVELAFHPTLTRSVNFDDDDRDDGLFLVLQPKNASGQIINSSASLTVEIMDPSRGEGEARIGFWKYSSSEVANKIQPIGSQQGIHLTLPWNGPNPKGDRVIVFVTYSFENGRQVIAHREIFIHGSGTLKTVWAPRAGVSNQASHFDDSSAVQPASGTVRNSHASSTLTRPSVFPLPDPAPRP
jgi:hypothetical protein